MKAQRNAQDNIRRELDAMPLPDSPLTEEQKRRILARACEKAGLKAPAAPGAGRSLRVGKSRPVRGRRRAVRTLLVAAAVVCLGTVTVAAAPAVLRMLQGEIPFFAVTPTASPETADPLKAPRGSYDSARAQLEAYNAPVGQSVTHDGVTMTLDTIAMDVSGMDAFFTIDGGEAIQGAIGQDGYTPDWDKLQALFKMWRTTVNGDDNALNQVQTDYYLNEAGQLQIWSHYLFKTPPQGEEIRVEIHAECNIGPEADSLYGDWQPFEFAVSLDGASVRAGGCTVQPGTYDMGRGGTIDPETAGLNWPELADRITGPTRVERPLYIRYLAFGPLGGSLTTDQGGIEYLDGVIRAEGLSGEELALADDTGKTIYASSNHQQNLESLNLTAPDPAATALTLTPVVLDMDHYDLQTRTVTMDQMRSGVQIPLSPLGGYTVRNFAIEDHAITYEMVPYGVWAGGDANLIPDDEGVIDLVESEATVLGGEQDGETVTIYHSGLFSRTVDGTTGVITVRHDYYAATREQIESIPGFRYNYQGAYSLDTDHALTLPLQPTD